MSDGLLLLPSISTPGLAARERTNGLGLGRRAVHDVLGSVNAHLATLTNPAVVVAAGRQLTIKRSPKGQTE